MKQSNRNPRGRGIKGRRVSGWFLFFLLVDLLVFGGFAIMYSESSGWEKALKNAGPVQTITPEMNGVVAVTGAFTSQTPAVDEDLAPSYALLVKEDRQWSCNSRKCSYIAVMTSTVGGVNGLSVNGIPLQPSIFRLTNLSLTLQGGTLRDPNLTVENNGVLVIKPKEIARSYAGVQDGEEVTVIGEAVDGQLMPIAFPQGTDSVLYAGLAPMAPKDMPKQIDKGYVVGPTLDAIIVHEQQMQSSVIWTLLIVGLLLLPVTLLFAPWPSKRRGVKHLKR